jgi:hypothetical protein
MTTAIDVGTKSDNMQPDPRAGRLCHCHPSASVTENDCHSPEFS